MERDRKARLEAVILATIRSQRKRLTPKAAIHLIHTKQNFATTDVRRAMSSLLERGELQLSSDLLLSVGKSAESVGAQRAGQGDSGRCRDEARSQTSRTIPEGLAPEAGRRGRRMKAQAWDVYVNGRLIDTVFFDEDTEKDVVRRSLIDHDGYPPNIYLRRPR